MHQTHRQRAAMLCAVRVALAATGAAPGVASASSTLPLLPPRGQLTAQETLVPHLDLAGLRTRALNPRPFPPSP
jgi:hypothetical protein